MRQLVGRVSVGLEWRRAHRELDGALNEHKGLPRIADKPAALPAMLEVGHGDRPAGAAAARVTEGGRPSVAPRTNRPGSRRRDQSAAGERRPPAGGVLGLVPRLVDPDQSFECLGRASAASNVVFNAMDRRSDVRGRQWVCACGSWFPSSGSCEPYGGLTEQPNDPAAWDHVAETPNRGSASRREVYSG